MKFICLSIVCFLAIYIKSIDADNHILDDENYYEKGVKHYDNAEFKESYIVFFNLSEKGHKSSIHNLSNMYFEGIGTTQDFKLSLKYTWLCSLNGNKKCLSKIDKVLKKLSDESILEVKNDIEKMLEEKYVDNQDPHAAFKLAYWFENFSPEIDLEKSYLWYSVSVSSGNYKAMKFRDRVGELLENDVIVDLQKEAFDIFTKQKYLDTKNKSGDES